MTNASRIKFAAVVTTLSIGGLTALGIALGREDSAVVAAESQTAPKARVIHRRKVRTAPANGARTSNPTPSPSSAATTAAAPAATPPVTQPAAVPEPQPVSTKVSPGGGGEEEGEHEDEYEAEDAEHEEYDD